MRFAMVFISASSIVVLSPSLLVSFQGIHEFRPKVRLLEHPRCFDKLVQRGDVQLPQPILLFARSWRWWHTSIMQQADVKGQCIRIFQNLHRASRIASNSVLQFADA
jgi:hypothetical protein